jgi:hypothetical protein
MKPVSLEPGTKQCTKVTNDCSRNMYGSNTSVAGQIREEIIKRSSGNLIVFHIIIHQDTLHCNFFLLELKGVINNDCNSKPHFMQGLEPMSVPAFSRRSKIRMWPRCLLLGSEMAEWKCNVKWFFLIQT